METRANYVIVGIFTLVAVMSAFAFVYWTSGVGTRTETVELRFRIPGSASGLGRGSAVLFNGVRVGEVERVYIDMNNPSDAIADAVISRQTPVTESTQADVGLAGLTGTANIELRGGDPGETNLLELSLEQGYPAEIEANPSAVSNLLESSQSILRRADSVLAQLEGFTSDARGPLTETVRNIEQFSTALGRNADGIDEFLESVASMAETLSGASGQLETTLAAGEDLIRAIDPIQINEAVGNIRSFTESLEAASADFAGLMGGVDEAVGALADFSQSANRTVLRVEAMVTEITPEMVRTTMENFQDASASINTAAADIAILAEDLGERTPDIDQIISDAQEIAGNLSQASRRVESIFERADQILESGEAEALIADAARTLEGYRDLALSVETRVGDVLAGVENLIGTSEAVVAEITPEMVRNAVQNFADASASINTAATDISVLAADLGGRSEDIDQIISDAHEIAGNLSQASRRVDSVFERADQILQSGEAEELIADASRTLEAYRNVALSVETRVNDVLESVEDLIGSGEAEGLMGEASETLQAYRDVAETVDARIAGVLDTLEGVLGSDETQGAIAEAGETMRAFRQVADTLNASLGPITQGLSRFANQGLREVEQLVRDSRRSISRIERAITDLERNPQRILTGGSGEVREHDGRVRR